MAITLQLLILLLPSHFLKNGRKKERSMSFDTASLVSLICCYKWLIFPKTFALNPKINVSSFYTLSTPFWHKMASIYIDLHKYRISRKPSIHAV